METQEPCHFLVIENEAYDAFLIQRAFRKVKRPSTVVVCRNLREAKAYLKGAGSYADRLFYPLPRAIISDLHLAIETGFDFLEWIGAEEGLKALPVIILTGSSAPAEIERAARMGASQVLQKPLESASLGEMLDELAKALCGEDSRRKG